MPHNNFFLILIALLALSACATPPVPPVIARVDPAGAALDKAILSKSANKLVGPDIPASLPIYGPRTTVSFLGDASTLLANVAKGRGPGWTFEVVGPQPHLPIYVQVHVKNAAFTDFLQNVAEQLGQRADIELAGSRILLRYRSQS